MTLGLGDILLTVIFAFAAWALTHRHAIPKINKPLFRRLIQTIYSQNQRMVRWMLLLLHVTIHVGIAAFETIVALGIFIVVQAAIRRSATVQWLWA